MYKHIKVFLIILLTASLLTSVFSGCSKSTLSDVTPTNTTEQPATVPSTQERLYPKLPEADFEGYEFRFFTKGPAYEEWANEDIVAEEENGEPINDAVYQRNSVIEDKYNVKLVAVPSANANMFADAKKVISAGDDAYDAMTLNMYDTSKLAAAGYLTDLKTIPNIDLSQPWWDQRANIDLTMGKRLYFTVGDLFIMDNDATWLTIFNKKLIADFDLESPYTLVKENKWTIDKLMEMAKGVYSDLNGNGERDREDMYGILTQGESITGLFLGSGERFVRKNDQDFPVLSVFSDRSQEVVSKVLELHNDPYLQINYWEWANEPRCFEVTQKMFENNHGLFKLTALQLVIRMRQMETNFGIVPVPKYDEAQDTYYNYVHATASCLSVPVTNTNLDRTGIILEALSAESRYTVRSAYYDISMNGKFLRDEESIAMLDIILETRIFEPAYMYDWSGLGVMLETMYRNKKTDFASEYEKSEATYTKQIEKTVEQFMALS